MFLKVVADVNRILKVIDDDLEALKAEKIRCAMGEIGNHDLGRKCPLLPFYDTAYEDSDGSSGRWQLGFRR